VGIGRSNYNYDIPPNELQSDLQHFVEVRKGQQSSGVTSPADFIDVRHCLTKLFGARYKWCKVDNDDQLADYVDMEEPELVAFFDKNGIDPERLKHLLPEDANAPSNTPRLTILRFCLKYAAIAVKAA
jgi:hypothetical protein